MKFNWTSRFMVLSLVILAGFLGQQKFRQYRLQKAIEMEKQNLQKQTDEFQGKTAELEQTLSFLNSNAYKEVIARQQLNMQKEGEEVYSFSDAPAATETAKSTPDSSSNFQKWINFFLSR